MKLELKPIELAEDDNEGRLVLHDGRLLAVLSCLSDQHAANAGQWFIECGFGPVSGAERYFEDLAEAEAWFNAAIGANPG